MISRRSIDGARLGDLRAPAAARSALAISMRALGLRDHGRELRSR